MFERKPIFEEWSHAPQMDTGAPEPALRIDAGELTLAYRTQTEEFAVVRFHRVSQHTFGYPNDEALPGHPLYSTRLNLYAFNRVVASPYLKELTQRNAVSFPNSPAAFAQKTHWLVSFHDETLEVVCIDEPEILGIVSKSSAVAALALYD